MVEALRGAGEQFGSFDILSDEDVRQGLKTYSNWPTFPQVCLGLGRCTGEGCMRGIGMEWGCNAGCSEGLRLAF